MYNQTELNIGIDTVVLKLEIKKIEPITIHSHFKLLKKIFTKYDIKLEYDFITEQHHYVIYNQFGSGIASVEYELKSTPKVMFTKYYITINLYGMSQVYSSLNKIQKEHILLFKWITQIKHKVVHIQKIDIALDHYNFYDNTLIQYGNNKEQIIKQHTRKISTITKFKTRHIYVHKSETKLIKTIINQTKIKLLPEEEKGGITNEYYNWILDEWNGARTDKSSASHIKFIIKNEYNYWKTYHAIYEQIENENDITYSSFIESKVVIDNRDKSNLKIINYDKKDREIEKIKKEMDKNKSTNRKDRKTMFTELMEERAESYNVEKKKIGWNRTELTFRDNIDIEDIETKLRIQIKKLSINLFSSKTECNRYKRDLKKDKKTKLKNYNYRELQVSDNQIEILMENLKLLLFMGI